MCVFFGTRRWLFQRSQTNLVTMRDKMEVSFLLDGLQAVSSSLHIGQKGNGNEKKIYGPESICMLTKRSKGV